jgi:hypothetical protein
MLFSDGECPNCEHQKLSLNIDDLIECPQCHLVFANLDDLLAGVLPTLGKGKFRDENTPAYPMQGMAFAKCKVNSIFADETKIFNEQKEIQQYFSQLAALI